VFEGYDLDKLFLFLNAVINQIGVSASRDIPFNAKVVQLRRERVGVVAR
jgi:hypothetical protein